ASGGPRPTAGGHGMPSRLPIRSDPTARQPPLSPRPWTGTLRAPALPAQPSGGASGGASKTPPKNLGQLELAQEHPVPVGGEGGLEVVAVEHRVDPVGEKEVGPRLLHQVLHPHVHRVPLGLIRLLERLLVQRVVLLVAPPLPVPLADLGGGEPDGGPAR